MSTSNSVLQALQAHDLKREGDNSYRSNSPFRPGSNSHAFTLTVQDDEHGAWMDHVSGESGSLYELAKRLNIPLPERPAPENTKRSYSGRADYARAHGLPDDVLGHWQWREVEKNNRPAMEFPTRTGARWRFLDGKKPHYTSPKDYQRCWYGLSAALQKRIADGAPLVMCNGEVSVIAGQHNGLAALAVTGGENTIPATLLDELDIAFGGVKPRVFVALDCDPTGRRVAPQVAAQFKERGYDAIAVEMALGLHGDLADFCMLYGSGAREALANLAPVQASDSFSARPWTIIPAGDLANLPPIAWLIPTVIPERGLTVIYGPSGVGKSFLALGYALTIAQARTVVYVAAEGQAGYHQRVAAWCKHNAKPVGKLYMCLGSPNLMDADDLADFMAEIAALGPSMVVVDTLAMAMIGGDENSARDMGRTVQACLEMARQIGCAVVLVHHTRKGDAQERGSSALRGACDSMIRVTGDDDVIIWESTKSKDSSPPEPQHLKLLPVTNDDGTESRVLVEADLIKQTESDPLTINQQKVLETLSLDIFANGATHVDLFDSLDFSSRGSMLRVISRLMQLGYVQQLAKGAPYMLTDAGKRRVNDSHDSHDSHDSPPFEFESCFEDASQGESCESYESSVLEIEQPTLLDVPTPKKPYYLYEL